MHCPYNKPWQLGDWGNVMSDAITLDFSEPIPLFPLPNTVLLPNATLPLHIFEQRYRQMTQDALDGNKLIAMATFAGDDWQADYAGNPPIRPVVCVGYIIRHQKVPDGRFNLLLQGLARATVVEEVAQEPYRRARLAPLDAEDTMEIDLLGERERLLKLLTDPTLSELAALAAVNQWATADVPTAALVDLTLMAMSDNTEQRYAVLAEADVFSRVSLLERMLLHTRRTLRAADRIGPAEDENGLCLN